MKAICVRNIPSLLQAPSYGQTNDPVAGVRKSFTTNRPSRATSSVKLESSDSQHGQETQESAKTLEENNQKDAPEKIANVSDAFVDILIVCHAGGCY